jgi:hypothetical protein
MTLELGDHVWYWNDMVSSEKNIPRAEWFPGSNPQDPTDYLGHGKEIFHYVVHADGIACGQPHMRNFPGSYAWLNNNPGNLTGVPGGANFGQYPEKFCWHNFLVFPSWAAGFDAIAMFLRTPSYLDLSLTAAFERYAPASDGNNPTAYAQDVANAAGVPVTTTVRELNDDQMRVMQEKIQEIEGAVAGKSLPSDSEELPSVVREQLP